MIRQWLLGVLLSLVFLAGATDARAQAQSREQALQALSHADAQVRSQAALRLAEVGVMADTPVLLRALHDEDETTRERAEQAAWQIWSRSGDSRVDKLYQTGVAQMNGGELHKSIATFTRVIQLRPGFAEGWNKRATLYYLLGENRKSLADCAQVIKRNPNHFGALAGYGQLYLRLEDYQRALTYFQRALEVNPNMDGVRRNILLLEQIIEQRRRDMV
ncbi:MAG: tetratricopeptide repeat protein [Betaproteobacteria bacterium]|nr:MAG: tetratricopeptide repeat protein [Betaproteobacteria bacterium]